MFEKEIKYITDVSLNKLKKLGAFFTFEQIRSSDVHPAITKYITAELDYLIYQDREKLIQKSAFDYSDPDIEKYFELIGTEIKKKKKISYEDAKTLIIQAVSFTANFVVRPKWSLTKFIYNEDQLKTVDEIKYSLNYLYYYDYLRNVLLTLIDKKKSVNFSLIDFEIALNKIDKELLADKKEKIIDNALYSISDFFGVGNKEVNQVSPNSIEMFLKEKDLIDHLFRLRRALPVDAKYLYDIDELKKILYTPSDSGKINMLASRQRINREIVNEKAIQENLFEQEDEEKEQQIVLEPENQKIKTENEIILNEADEQGARDTEDEPMEDKIEDFESPDEMINEDTEVKNSENEKESEDLIGDELNSELSPNDDLLEAFDSQLKALEEESKLLVDEDENKLEEDLLRSEENEKPEENAKIKTDENTDEIEIELKGIKNTEIEPNEGKYEDFQQNNLDNPDKADEVEDIKDEDTAENELSEEEIVDEKTNRTNKQSDLPPANLPLRKKDIFSFLTDKEIDRIVSNVFNEDREDFANTMEKVSECVTYDEATEILKTVFFSYRINPYSKDAVTLTNSVSNYFNQAG
ncbi:MAG TPA: hypothetical protein VKA26_04085 [Ignavibacteriaceae bacterium]|nr:hypothetical protein [Ignavibacteriaceae bacterium]